MTRIQYRINYKHPNAPHSYDNDSKKRSNYHKWYYWNVIKKNRIDYNFTFSRTYKNIILTFD